MPFARPARALVAGSSSRRRLDIAVVTLASVEPPAKCGVRPSGAQQLVAHVHRLKPFAVELGADGSAITRLFESISCISSDAFRPGFAPLTVAFENVFVVRFGSAARPAPFVPNTSG